MIQMLPQLGVLKAVRIDQGDPERVRPDTALLLILVMRVDWPFVRRPDCFYSHLLPQVGAEFIVYTPEEFDETVASNSRVGKTVRQGQVLYDERAVA